MKALFAIASIAIAGCAALPADPAQIQLTLEPVTQACGASDRAVPVRITVRNVSQGELRIQITEMKEQPPYALSWLRYKVLGDEGVDYAHGPGGHGPVLFSTLSIGSGDSAQVVGSVYELKAEDYAKSFRIQFEDEAGHTYVSVPFKPCVMP